MSELINKLITKEGYGLRSWDDKYSKGVWVCLAPDSYSLEEVESASDAGDLDMIPATEFILSTEWLPFVVGSDFIEALNQLEARLKSLPEEQIARKSQWSYAISQVLEHLRDVSNSSNDYGGMEGAFRGLSSDYLKIWD